MNDVPPYAETETLPRGARVLLVPVACIFLVGPYGVMLSGGPSNAITWALTAFAVVVGAVFAGAGIAQPRRSIGIDGAEHTITFATTARLPAIGLRREIYDFSAVTGTRIIEVGTKKTSSYGFRVILDFGQDRQLALRRVPTADRAQDILDHVVHLGLPGHSRAAEREALLDAAPPTTWL